MSLLRPLVWQSSQLRVIASGDYLAPGVLGAGTPSATTFLGGDNSWGRQQPRVQTVATTADNGTITMDLGLYDVVDLTLGHDNTTIECTGGYDGQSLRLRLRQDSTGGRQIILGSSIRLPTDMGVRVLNGVDPYKWDWYGFMQTTQVHGGVAVRYDFVSFTRGFGYV